MKAAMIVVPIVLIMSVIGAALAGFVQIPGLSPEKKKADLSAPKDSVPSPQVQPAPAISKPGKKTKKAAPPAAIDEQLGNKRLAKLWNELDTKTLLAIVAKWKNPELAGVLSKMEPRSVADLLTAMKPDRASKLSRELKRQASMAPKP